MIHLNLSINQPFCFDLELNPIRGFSFYKQILLFVILRLENMFQML